MLVERTVQHVCLYHAVFGLIPVLFFFLSTFLSLSLAVMFFCFFLEWLVIV